MYETPQFLTSEISILMIFCWLTKILNRNWNHACTSLCRQYVLIRSASTAVESLGTSLCADQGTKLLSRSGTIRLHIYPSGIPFVSGNLHRGLPSTRRCPILFFCNAYKCSWQSIFVYKASSLQHTGCLHLRGRRSMIITQLQPPLIAFRSSSFSQ